MKIFSKNNFFINKKYFILLIVLLISGLIVSILETIGLGVIALFVMVLTDSETLISKIPIIYIREYFETKSEVFLIIFFSILITAIFLIKNIVVIMYSYFELNLKRLIVTYNRIKLYNMYLNVDYIFYLKNNSATLINNVISVVNLCSHYLFLIVRVFKDIILLIFLMATLFFVNTKISVIIFIFMTLVSLIIYLLIKNKIKKLGKESIILEADLLKELHHGIGSIKITKILGNFNFFLNNFKNTNEKRLKNEVLNGFLQMLPRLFLEVLAILSLTLSVLFFYLDGKSIETILPAITLLTVVIIRMLPVFINLNLAFNNLKYFRSGFDAIKNEYEYLNSFTAKTLPSIEIKKKSDEISNINKIEIKNVGFSYVKEEDKVLNDISLKVNSGEFIGIIGKSGSGKSTLIDVILGLLKPDFGEVLVNSKNINHDYPEWQKNIGYVPQDVYLIDDTIKRNIALGKLDHEIDSEKLKTSLELSQLKDFVETLPDKIFTKLGDRGARLSGGQKQRIGIARALYNNSKVIIFDEATSALDIETEKKIINDVYKLRNDRIIIFITHRTNSLTNCDKVFVIKNGHIIDEGSFNQIMERHQYLSEI